MSIVKVTKNTYTVEPLHQWDVNQVLQVYGLALAKAPEVHFTNAATNRAIPRQASMDAAGVITVNVPNSLLQKPYAITAHICGYTGTTFETLYKLAVPVRERAQPADYTLVNDEEVYSFNKLENDVQNATRELTAANQAVKSAEATLTNAANTIDAKVDNSVKAALPGFLDDTMTDPAKAAQAAGVGALGTELRGLIGARAQSVKGSYVGAGADTKTLTFPFVPKFVCVTGGGRSLYAVNGDTSVSNSFGSSQDTWKTNSTNLNWVEKSLTLSQVGNTPENNNYIGVGPMNKAGAEYLYAAFG